MTFYAQPLVAGSAQIIFVESAVAGVMAGDAGHCPTVTWVVSIITGWMTEGIMILMTTDTSLIPFTFQHGWCGCSVKLMTIQTTLSMGMEVKTLFAVFKFAGVTITAHFPRITTNQTRLLTGVRGMTTETE